MNNERNGEMTIDFKGTYFLVVSRSNNRDAQAAVSDGDALINDCSNSQWFIDNHVEDDEDADFAHYPEVTRQIVADYIDQDAAWSRMIEVPRFVPDERSTLQSIVDEVPVEGMAAAERALARFYGGRHAQNFDDLFGVSA